MTKLLMAVCSCQRDLGLGYHTHIRNTWAPKVSDMGDVRFFVGGERPSSLLADEVWVDAPDDYDSLPAKMKEIFKYALSNDYSHCFKCDCDTVVCPYLFRQCLFDQCDVMGRFYGGKPGDVGCAPAGGGYFLSRKAMEIVIAHKSTSTAEDWVTGEALQPHIKAGNIFALIYGGIQPFLASANNQGAPHDAKKEPVVLKRKARGLVTDEMYLCEPDIARKKIERGDAILVWGKL